MFLIASALCLALYFTDVMLGAYGGGGALPVVGEFLLLSLTAILFVVAILRAERDAPARPGSDPLAAESTSAPAASTKQDD